VSFRPCALTMSIPESFNHPGVGCCIIDDDVSFKSVQALLKLFASLPVDVNQKPKKNIVLCSALIEGNINDRVAMMLFRKNSTVLCWPLWRHNLLESRTP
jgi:hypothetical protein